MDTLILTFPCKPGHGKELLAILKTALVDTRAFKGCISVTTFTDADNPDDVILIEEWDHKSSQVAYMNWRAEIGTQELLGPLLTGPLRQQWLDSHAV